MVGKELLALVCLLLLLPERSNGSEYITRLGSNMVCKPVAGIFGPIGSEKSSTERGIHPVQPGPRGPIGEPGKEGVKGPRGEPDYDRVSKMVETQVNTLKGRLQDVESSIKELIESRGSVDHSSPPVQPTENPKVIKNELACMKNFSSPITVGDTCFKLIGGDGVHWTYSYAESNCTKLGGYLADLNTRETYDKIYHYVDKTYSTVVQAWTGMRYENDHLLKTNGEHPAYSKWMAYNPRKSKSSYSSYYKSYTHIYVNIDTSSRVNGLQNTPSTRKLAYAICNFYLSGNAATTRSTTTQSTTTETYDYDDYYNYD